MNGKLMHRAPQLNNPVSDSFLSSFDNLDAAVYISDITTHEVIYCNNYLKEKFGEIQGRKCFEALQSQSAPCPFCTNKFLVHEDGSPSDRIYKWEFYNPVSQCWYELRDQAIRWTDGRTVRLEIAFDITGKKKNAENLQLHDSILQSVLFAAERFLHCTDWHAEVAAVLEELGNKARVSMVCLYQYAGNDEKGHLYKLSSWAAPDSYASRNPVQASAPLDLKHFTEMAASLHNKEIFQKIVADLVSPIEKQYFIQLGILSFCLVPIILEQQLWGAICFADCRNSRVWSSVEIGALRAAANILGAAVRRQSAEKELMVAHQELERKVEDRTRELRQSHELLRREVAERKRTAEKLDSRSRELEEVNIALRVLLQQSSEAKLDLEKRVVANLNELILPYLDDLSLLLEKPRKKELLNIIRENLRQITSSFSMNINTTATGLTSREIQIAGFIKQGKSNKQIAELSGLSLRTVETYRNRIRHKLGIRNKKINLQTYLASLSRI